VVRLEKTQYENLAFHVGGAQQRDGKISLPSAKDFAAAESTGGGGLKLIIARVRLRHIQIHPAQSLRERKRFALKAAPLL
jgi:hypothetical protein